MNQLEFARKFLIHVIAAATLFAGGSAFALGDHDGIDKVAPRGAIYASIGDLDGVD